MIEGSGDGSKLLSELAWSLQHKTTEIYIHVATKGLSIIKNLLDSLLYKVSKHNCVY
jgi:hypothetical protein